MVSNEVCKSLGGIFLGGALAAGLFFGGAAPGPLFGEFFPEPLIRSSREGLFISFSWKKETKQRKSTGCTDFSKNRALQAKTQKLGALLLKQFAFLYAYSYPIFLT